MLSFLLQKMDKKYFEHFKINSLLKNNVGLIKVKVFCFIFLYPGSKIQKKIALHENVSYSHFCYFPTCFNINKSVHWQRNGFFGAE